ncbi:MAG: trehalose-phosphatase [Candidatus Omnitrophica bacterium]|nr:trehalose-phosphatase [Candidatus Omnitrophota bacterium]MDD5593017.1 trehalose-phosphatase [Candidatus Omnitrophota bacterium]
MDYLFDKWARVASRLQEGSIFIFLDFDGTLAPIALTPEKASLPAKVKETLKKISNKTDFTLAFISGRSLKDIKEKIGLKNVIYSGNHGLEIEGPKIKFAAPLSLRYKAILGKIKNDLENKLTFIKGVFIEDKGLSLAIHYRLADKKQVPLVKTIFHETVIIHLVRNKIKIKAGKKVLEIRPPLEWDKGRVVLWLLARQKFASSNSRVIPVYMGDDITDEDAFKALSHRGITIFVGSLKQSCAQYYLKDTDEVAEFLRRILAIKEERS